MGKTAAVIVIVCSSLEAIALIAFVIWMYIETHKDK